MHSSQPKPFTPTRTAAPGKAQDASDRKETGNRSSASFHPEAQREWQNLADGWNFRLLV